MTNTNEKYTRLVEMYNTNPDRIKVASESLLGMISNGRAPIHAYVIVDENGSEVERVSLKDMPLNDLEKCLIGEDQNRAMEMTQKTAQIQEAYIFRQYLPRGREPRGYETKIKAAKKLQELFIDILSENNADAYSLQNVVMDAKLRGISVGQEEYDTALLALGRINVRMEEYKAQVERFKNLSPSLLEYIFSMT